MSPKKILILIHRVRNEATSPDFGLFLQALQPHFSANAHVTMGALHDLTFEINAWDGIKVYDSGRNFSLTDFDLVVFRLTRGYEDRVAVCCQLLKSKGIPYIDTMHQVRPLSKVAGESMRYAAGLSVISTFFASAPELTRRIQAQSLPFTLPYILKDSNGSKGRNNFLITHPDQAVAAITAEPDIDFMAQEFIPNRGDYRFLIMGYEVKMVIYRRASRTSHLNNTSQGGQAKLVPVSVFDQRVIDDAIRAARIENIEVAGVDVMFHEATGQHYILEVNSSPQLASGAFPELKLQAYADYLQRLSSSSLDH